MNDIKEDRYREAYERIDSAISSGFSFEAIAIVESVLSDRICSFLRSVDKNKYKNVYRKPFASLIQLWEAAVHYRIECTKTIKSITIRVNICQAVGVTF